jgi:transposase-like protein
MRPNSRWDLTFRADALALFARGDRTMHKVAHDLGVPLSTFQHWYRSDMAKKGKKKPPLSPAARSAVLSTNETADEKVARLEREVAALRARNAELEEDRAILKKAAAFFAKESE